MDTKPAPRLITAAMMASVSVFLFVAFLYNDLGNVAAQNAPAPGIAIVARYLVAMAIGGAAAGFLFAGLFGRQGMMGWVFALVGGTLATLTAGVTGSVIGLLPERLSDGWQAADLIPIVSGAMILPFALSDWPALTVVWPAMIFATHIWARNARR